MVLPQCHLWALQLGFTGYVQVLQHVKARGQLATLSGSALVEAASASYTLGAQGGCWRSAELACPLCAGPAHSDVGSALAYGDVFGQRFSMLER